MRTILLAAMSIGLAAGGDLLDRVPRGCANANPMEGNADARRAGAKLYARECAGCHGSNREGRGQTPSLNRAVVYQAPPGALYWVLRNGSLSHGMPSFAHLPEPQRWQIVTFLRANSRER